MNPLDKKYVLPQEFKTSKKNVCQYIRKAAAHSKETEIPNNEEIPEEIFNGFTDLESIEKMIFDTVLDGKHDVFVLRLYVVKQNLNTFGKKIKGFISRFISKVGTAHLAVQISDKMVHWFDSSLVLVQGYEGSNATAVFYPQDKEGKEVPIIDNTPEIRKKICQVIQRYNCEKKYDLKSVNCQNFASDIFKVLDLQNDFMKMAGNVGNYLKYITGPKGSKSDTFACLVNESGHIMRHTETRKNGEKEEKVEFDLKWESHEQLDNHCTSEFLNKYANFQNLIKAFHRGFQMRERAALKRGEEAYQSTYCPFGMPTVKMIKPHIKDPINIYDIDSFHSYSLTSFSVSGNSFSSN